MGIIESIIGIIAATSSAVAVGVSASAVVTAAGMVYGVMYGGYSVYKNLSAKKTRATSSPTYTGSLQTQVNNQLPIAPIYGENKLAGNVVWQQLDENNTVIKRLVAFGEGEVFSIEDIRLNDTPIAEIPNVSCRVYCGLPQLQLDSMIPGTTTDDKIANAGSLKNIAYIALSVRASSYINGSFNTTAVVKGKKVRIYTEEMVYTTAYSNNPAWCLLDFMTSYNGCAIGIREDGTRDDALIAELIDINSFISAAQFCDEPIEGKPRFSFNMIFDTKASRRDLIEEFKKACRGALVLKGKQLQLKIDRSQAPVKVIEAKDIIPSTEQITTIPTEENFDRIIVKYRSKNNDWAVVETYAERAIYSNTPPIEHVVEILSVTEHSQATRLAWYYLNKVNMERTFGYFETDYRVFDLEIGDVIALNDNLMGYEGKNVKVTRLIDKNDGTFGVYWREYASELYTDTPGALEPSVNRQSLADIFRMPPNIDFFSVMQNANLFIFSWRAVSMDNVSYEIRLGQSWENSVVYAEYVKNTSMTAVIDSKGLKSFFIKAKSPNGVYSQTASQYIINVEDIPDLNFVVRHSLFENVLSLENCYITRNELRLSPNYNWISYSENTWDEINYFKNGGKWGAKTLTEGVFVSGTFDLLTGISCLLSVEAEQTEVQSADNVRYYIKTSSDGVEWSDWSLYQSGSYEMRYYQVKIAVSSQEDRLFSIKNACVNVDVLDRDEYYKDIEVTNAQSGVTINFAQNPQSRKAFPFTVVPAVVANISDGTSGFCVVSNKNSQQCTIKIYNTSNQLICAKIDVRVKGY